MLNEQNCFINVKILILLFQRSVMINSDNVKLRLYESLITLELFYIYPIISENIHEN